MREQIYRPGAGILPPYLAGRDEILSGWDAALAAHSQGRQGFDHVLTGLRGTGKSVLLTEMRLRAEARGFATIALQAPADKTLPQTIVRAAESRRSSRWAKILERFGVRVSMSMAGPAIEAGIQPPSATQGPPVHDANVLAELLASLAGISGTQGLIVTIDELQMADPVDLRVVGAALNQLNTAFPDARVLFAGAGLPNLAQRMIGSDPDHPVITNPERLFRMRALEPTLSRSATSDALNRPASEVGVQWDDDAVAALYEATAGSPALIQIYAAAAWTHAEQGAARVTLSDVVSTRSQADDEVAVQFLAGRWNRLSPRLREYLVAVALSRTGTSQEIARIVGRPPASLWRQRDELLGRGEIFESGANSVALTMPAMGPYALTEYPSTRANSDIDLATPADMLSAREQWWAQRQHDIEDRFPSSVVSEVRGIGQPGAAGGIVSGVRRELPPGSPV